MFAVCVDLWIKPGQMGAFLPIVMAHAALSVSDEAGCRQFDVIRSDKDPDLVVLFQLYVDDAAFENHLMSDRFAEFDVACASMLQTKSIVKGPRVTADSA